MNIRWTILALGAALAIGVAHADPFGFVDAVDHAADRDREVVYLALASDGDRLLVRLDGDSNDATILPVEFEDVPIVVRDGLHDAADDDVTASYFTRSNLTRQSPVRAQRHGALFRHLELQHDDTALDHATDRYVAALEALGYDVSVQRSTNGNGATIAASAANGDAQAIRLFRAGSDTNAMFGQP